MSVTKILLVDDDRRLVRFLKDRLEYEKNFKVIPAYTIKEARDAFNKQQVDLILLDIELPDGCGLTQLEEWITYDRELPVIIFTAHGTINLAVEAMQKGAVYFLTKPCPQQQIVTTINRFLEKRNLQRSHQLLKESQYPVKFVGTQSKVIQEILRNTEQVAGTDSTVLILGESGTGKELIAHRIHEKSRRNAEPFVKVDCTLLSEEMLESDLFGHEKGAFTGAHQLKKGRFELANGGTILLDEIGDLTPRLQAKLLRIIQDRAFERVGGTTTLSTDVRILTATNRDLQALVKEGQFRQDLFYRLKVVVLHIPSLRERKEDIPELVEYFICKCCKEQRKKIPSVSASALTLLQNYTYPGNVRELENIIERIIVFLEGEQIEPYHLPAELKEGLSFIEEDHSGGFKEKVNAYKKQLIIDTLSRCNGKVSRAAEQLKMPRTYIYQLIQDLKIDIHE